MNFAFSETCQPRLLMPHERSRMMATKATTKGGIPRVCVEGESFKAIFLLELDPSELLFMPTTNPLTQLPLRKKNKEIN